MTDPGHLFILGGSGSGKSYLANRVHREWDGVSIYCNLGDAQIWGERVKSPNALASNIHRGSKKISYVLPDNRDEAVKHLHEIKERVFRWGQDAKEPWIQVVIDEAHEFTRDSMPDDPVRILATRGRHAGARLAILSQYPTPIAPTTRTNLGSLVVFAPGVEGLQFLRNKGYPADAIAGWTKNRYHFVVFKGTDVTPLYRTPIRG